MLLFILLNSSSYSNKWFSSARASNYYWMYYVWVLLTQPWLRHHFYFLLPWHRAAGETLGSLSRAQVSEVPCQQPLWSIHYQAQALPEIVGVKTEQMKVTSSLQSSAVHAEHLLWTQGPGQVPWFLQRKKWRSCLPSPRKPPILTACETTKYVDLTPHLPAHGDSLHSAYLIPLQVLSSFTTS